MSNAVLLMIEYADRTNTTPPTSANPLPINLNTNPLQPQRPERNPPRLPRLQPRQRMLIVKRPRWHHGQERQRRAAEPNVKCLVDVLRAETDEEGDGAG